MAVDKILSLENSNGLVHHLTFGAGLALVSGALTSQMELVERKSISVAATTVTFSGLDGETDEIYLLESTIKNGSSPLSNVNYSLRPNGVTTNLHGRVAEFTGAQFNNSTVSDIIYCRIAVAQNSVGAFALFFARRDVGGTAMVRGCVSQDSYRSGAANANGALLVGLWDESATTLTSFDVVASVSSGIGAGSILSLYRWRQS